MNYFGRAPTKFPRPASNVSFICPEGGLYAESPIIKNVYYLACHTSSVLEGTFRYNYTGRVKIQYCPMC